MTSKKRNCAYSKKEAGIQSNGLKSQQRVVSKVKKQPSMTAKD